MSDNLYSSKEWFAVASTNSFDSFSFNNQEFFYEIIRLPFGKKLFYLREPFFDDSALTAFRDYSRSKNAWYLIELKKKLSEPQDCFDGLAIDLKNISFSKKVRYDIRKAESSSLSFKKLDTEDEWKSYVRIHEDLMSSQQKTSAFKKNYLDLFKKNNTCVWLFGAYKKNVLVSGILVFFKEKSIIFRNNATSDEGYTLGAVPFLINKICLFAAKKEYTQFDMNVNYFVIGYSKESKPGKILHFKKRFSSPFKKYVYASKQFMYLRKIRKLVGK